MRALFYRHHTTGGYVAAIYSQCDMGARVETRCHRWYVTRPDFTCNR